MSLHSRRGVLRTLAISGTVLSSSGCAAVPSLPWSDRNEAVDAPRPTPAPGQPVAAASSPTPRVGPPNLALTGTASTLPGRLLFVADANIWLLERGQLQPITEDRVSRQPSWSHNGGRIAMVKYWTSGSDVVVTSDTGGQPQEITDFTYKDDVRQNYALQPIWTMDDRGIYFLSQEGAEDTQLWQVSLADKRRQRFLTHGERAGGLDHPRLSPDGRLLAVASFQPGRGESGRPQIWTYALPNGPWRQLTSHPGGAYDPEWSPDGRLAFTVRTAEPGRPLGRHDVWVMHADGSGAQAVTTSGMNRSPSWSPDGAWLAYLSARTGTFDIWMVPAPADQSTNPGSGQSRASNVPGSASPAAASSPAVVARQVTQNGALDAVSGLAWAR